jgi:hypothetical protein
MQEPDDWRLRNQLSYLKGAELQRQPYHPPREGWDHDHCEFCWAKFMERDGPEILREGYVTIRQETWVCVTCFEDFKDLFDWKVVDSRPADSDRA